jgi:sulfoacetaldehyde acetyltransferase
MKIISGADVVLALGTRLGPFGSLPQYGFDYWPKSAKIIQVRRNAVHGLSGFFKKRNCFLFFRLILMLAELV